MVEVKITYETLFDLLRREKSKEELQRLDTAFYHDVLDYLKSKQALVDQHAGSGTEERYQLQFRNVKRLLRELYDRRERKVVRLALNKARTSDAQAEVGQLLANEAHLYRELVDLLIGHRRELLTPLLNLETPDAQYLPARGEGVSEPGYDEDEPEQEAQPPRAIDEPGAEAPILAASGALAPEQVTLTFLKDVPKFVGKSLEIHGPFKTGEQASLPSEVAEVLIRKGHAQPSA